MTTQKSFKRRVRARMEKTGESYTAARAQLAVRPAEPEPLEPPIRSDASVRRGTGRGWREWCEILDAWGAAERSHRDIARWVGAEHGIDGWWAQTVTVGYEQLRGRQVGQRADGTFSASASKTVGVPLERLFAAFEDAALRTQWLGDAALTVRGATAGKRWRADWEDGAGSRVVAGFTAKGEAKSSVALEHSRLPDGAAADEMKAYWRERLAALKSLLER